MTLQRKCIATKAGVSLALLCIATLANAAPIGTVTELDGNLLVSRANGSIKVLGLGSSIEQGDVLSSTSETYATLALADNSSITLGPETNLKLERYVYNKDTADSDGALFALAKGSVRIVTGLLGTRSGDTFTLATAASTFDIRGASVVVDYVPDQHAKLAWRDSGLRDPNTVAVVYTPDAAPGPVRTAGHANTLQLAQGIPMPTSPAGGSRAPGLYVQVLDGLISVTNSAGAQTFQAGQFGFVANFNMPPVIVPKNPGLIFSPPPVFSRNTTPGAPTTGTTKSKTVDCEVR
ncbi:MAG TPA: FecR domain-containing protein [Steroidobacteraceae bacterium]|jgi:hypothetical protein